MKGNLKGFSRQPVLFTLRFNCVFESPERPYHFYVNKILKALKLELIKLALLFWRRFKTLLDERLTSTLVASMFIRQIDQLQFLSTEIALTHLPKKIQTDFLAFPKQF